MGPNRCQQCTVTSIDAVQGLHVFQILFAYWGFVGPSIGTFCDFRSCGASLVPRSFRECALTRPKFLMSLRKFESNYSLQCYAIFIWYCFHSKTKQCEWNFRLCPGWKALPARRNCETDKNNDVLLAKIVYLQQDKLPFLFLYSWSASLHKLSHF